MSIILFVLLYFYFKAGDPSTYLNVVQCNNTFSAWCSVRVWKAKGQSLKCHSLCAVPGPASPSVHSTPNSCISEEFFFFFSFSCSVLTLAVSQITLVFCDLSFYLLALQPYLASTALNQSSAHQAGSSASVKVLVF